MALPIMHQDNIFIKIENRSGHPLPEYATSGSSGMDLRAWLPAGSLTLAPGERKLIPTGLRVEIPRGFEAQIRPRSGLALKKGLTVLNAPGTIDSDYRGEIGVILINLGAEPVTINDADRICQMVIAPVTLIHWSPADTNTLSDTTRGEGGFGHSGAD